MNQFFSLLGIIALLNVGCASNSAFEQHYSPKFEYPPLSDKSRVVVTYAGTEKELGDAIANLKKQGLKGIGHSAFDGRQQPSIDAVKQARKVGAHHVVICTKFLGQETGSRMVLAEYTPGRLVSTNSYESYNAQAQGYGSAHGYGYGSVNSYATAYGSGSSSSSSSTYIPSTSRYERENFVYDAYHTTAIYFRAAESTAAQNAGRAGGALMAF